MITSLTVDRVGTSAFRLNYVSDLSEPVTFYIYRDGVLLIATTQTYYDVTIPAGATTMTAA